MIEYAESEGFVYSRYADDIYLSSKRFIDNGAFRFVDAMLHQQGFIINQSKTRYMSNKNRKMVTGLILTDDHRVSVGLDMRRQVKDMLYKMMTRHEGDAAVVQGYLAFIKDIEPHTYNKLIIKYSKYGNVKDILSK
jgi:hypothetical protein